MQQGERATMRHDLFEELLESAREGMAILRDEAEPSRVFTFPEVNVAELRARYRMSQPKFAAMLGISVGTLRRWEQGRRRPGGPARVLLGIAAQNPDAVRAASGAAEHPGN
jgi:putative transcriptional regulator